MNGDGDGDDNDNDHDNEMNNDNGSGSDNDVVFSLIRASHVKTIRPRRKGGKVKPQLQPTAAATAARVARVATATTRKRGKAPLRVASATDSAHVLRPFGPAWLHPRACRAHRHPVAHVSGTPTPLDLTPERAATAANA